MVDNRMRKQWPRLRDLTEEEREAFGNWLRGSAAPMIEGLPHSEQDAYYPWDYERWKSQLAKAAKNGSDESS